MAASEKIISILRSGCITFKFLVKVLIRQYIFANMNQLQFLNLLFPQDYNTMSLSSIFGKPCFSCFTIFEKIKKHIRYF